jgi:uncharacterized protein (DUF305 family)
MRHLLPVLTILAAPAFAQSTDHSAHTGHGTPQGIPYAEALAAANEAMHRDMGQPLTGDADVDFIKGMIPHHQGAVEMARIVLEHGQDPEVRKLAEAVIAAQEAEIAWMKEWLAKKGQ